MNNNENLFEIKEDLKLFLLYGGGIGTIISLALFCFPEIVDINKNDGAKNVYWFCLEFFWPSSPYLAVLDMSSYSIDAIVTLIFIVGLNTILYAAFGWLAWLGKSKSLFFYFLPPCALIFTHYLLYRWRW